MSLLVALLVLGWIALVGFFLLLFHGADHPVARGPRRTPKSPALPPGL